MLPRLEGGELEDEKAVRRYLRLVRKGVAGFILFGGRLEGVREGIGRLQRETPTPLVIASDLEQGLGQQVEGGTLFPPAMAFGQALANGAPPQKLGRAFSAMAREARHAGVNMILAPVLDINSNPLNPIIATRAFGEVPETAGRLGSLMIREIQKQGVYACGKHFPGHGDTRADSHVELPVIGKTLEELSRFELKPFKAAIKAGVSSMMLGHLMLPLIDPSGLPATLSGKAVALLREKLGFKGLILTDAMNMAGLSMEEGKASLLALRAGVNVLLHPGDTERVARHIGGKNIKGRIAPLRALRRALAKAAPSPKTPPFEAHRRLALEIALEAIRVEGRLKINGLGKNAAVIVLSDTPETLAPFMDEIGGRHKVVVNPKGGRLPAGRLLAVVHSVPRAWRPPSEGLKRNIGRLSLRDVLWLSFGNPYLVGGQKNKVLAYCDLEGVQRRMARMLLDGRPLN